jgi:hypothetical protein
VRALIALAILASGIASAQKLPWQADETPAQPPQSVKFLYPEQVSVTAGKESVVELHFKINPGLHINSHMPREKSFIPTQLIVAEPAGVKIGPVDFPEGSDYSLAFAPNEKLSVYTGEFVVRAHITAQAGDHLLDGVLRYQACDTNACYPPRKAPVAVDIVAR